eukprot:TRINITY_DN39055_c0_g1_i1.p1 TRINITY_DN39055_c0_g1~~TRINITY_DN39055_c0_g1_i1.p1  ORF type:complete len:509 (-),score=96.62 TRINITY_DN39055_c0_g1_i1:36-1562(-)
MAASSRLLRLQRALASPGFKHAATIAGKASAGILAAGAGLAIGLREAKRALRYETPVDLWSQASFDVRRSTAGTPESAAAASALAALPGLCARAGISEEDFWAAARRLSPVEIQLEELHESFVADAKGASKLSPADRHTKEDELVATWKELGYFDQNVLMRDRANTFGRRLTSDAQGVDIGVLVPPYLSSNAGRNKADAGDEVPSTQAVAWKTPASISGTQTQLCLRDAAESSLDRWGCVLLRGLLSAEDILQLKTALGIGGVNGKDGRHIPSRRAAEIGMWMEQHDPNILMGRFTFGRLHVLLRGSPIFEPEAVAPHASLAPLVHGHFKEEQRAGKRIFLSEAQLIIADPLCEMQRWHLDAVGGRGISVFVPLTNVALDRGPQQVLPGTHSLHDPRLSFREGVRRCLSALCATHGAVSTAEGLSLSPKAFDSDAKHRIWAAGDALVLDAAALHRGLTNESLGAPAPVLVLRYDVREHPPPGCRRSWLVAMQQLGSMLDSVFRLYAFV